MTDVPGPISPTAASSEEAGTPSHQGFLAFFTTNSVSANLIMLVMLIGGFVAATQLKTELFPTVKPGIIRVSVPYPGATPEEVEESITKRVDDAVFGIDGVEKVTSNASENMGTINIELKDFVDEDRVRDDVESAIDQIIDFPPVDAEQPDIVVEEATGEVMRLVVTSDGDEKDLRAGAAAFEQALLSVPSVTQSSLDGVRDYEITIEVSEQALRMYQLTMEQVANAVRRNSLNLTSGELRTNAGDLLLRTNKKGLQGSDFEKIVVRASPHGTVLRVRDIATVVDGFADIDLIQEFNGRPAVFLRVLKSEAEDILTIAKDIKAALPSIELPEGISVEIWEDQTNVLEERLSLLLRNGALGFTLVILFLVVMLDLRLAYWVAMGVPISFAGGFLFFGFLDVSITMVSLFALIVVLGIVVDDAIVIGENIGKERERGLSPVDASLAGVRGVIAPVSVGVVTTMIAFAPLLFVTGTFGQILGVVPVVVIAVLIMSLIEVFFILPAHLAHPGTWSRWPLTWIQEKMGSLIHSFRDEILIPMVRRAIRHRYITLLCALIFLSASLSLLAFGVVRFVFFPQLEGTTISAQLTFPVGTPFHVTEEAAQQVRAAAFRLNESTERTAFKAINYSVGGRAAANAGPGGSSDFQVASNVAAISINLNPEPLRKLSATELERMWRQEAGVIPGVEQANFTSGFFGGFNRLNYDLSHINEDRLNAAADLLEEELYAIEGLVEITNSLTEGKRQFDIELTPEGEAAGLTPADVSRQLRRSFFGEEVHRIQRGRDELRVMVRFPKDERQDLRDIYNTRIRLNDGTQVPLVTVADLIENRSFSSIQRIDGLRTLTVSGEIDIAVLTPNEAIAYVEADVIPKIKTTYPGLRIEATGASEEQSRDLESLGFLSIFAISVIYVLLATLLRSYIQPFIILIGVPFGTAGAIIGHLLLGHTLSFVSIFGMIALSGVVVNDSLILVDLFNKLRRAGLNVLDATIEATRGRFRAIFLTTATTSLGLTPMLFETSMQAQFLIPMAVSLAIGILFASIMIVFVVPALILIREDIRFKEPDLQQDITHEQPRVADLVST